jgi:hypothetical protein
MTDKGMLVVQDCARSQEDLPGSGTETRSTSPGVFQTINIKVEDISDVEEVEDPLPISFPGIQAERAVSCFISSLIDSRASVAACFI